LGYIPRFEMTKLIIEELASPFARLSIQHLEDLSLKLIECLVIYYDNSRDSNLKAIIDIVEEMEDVLFPKTVVMWSGRPSYRQYMRYLWYIPLCCGQGGRNTPIGYATEELDLNDTRFVKFCTHVSQLMLILSIHLSGVEGVSDPETSHKIEKEIECRFGRVV